jgi:pimeloyl-ACP methyl ester carboxylesterase
VRAYLRHFWEHRSGPGWSPPDHDALFPVAWSDRLDQFLADVDVHVLDGVGHFVPLQAPDAVAGAIRAATGTSA